MNENNQLLAGRPPNETARVTPRVTARVTPAVTPQGRSMTGAELVAGRVKSDSMTFVPSTKLQPKKRG